MGKAERQWALPHTHCLLELGSKQALGKRHHERDQASFCAGLRHLVWGGGSENSDPTQHSSVGGGKTALTNDVLACTLFAAAGTSVDRAKKQTTDFSLT